MSKTFEIAIFNEEVRRLNREGARHKQLAERWADTHYFEIRARDENDARHRISMRYPREQGYVIEQVVVVQDEED